MSYTELEHGYQGLRKTRTAFYSGHETGDLIRGVKSSSPDVGEDVKQVVVGICAMAKKTESKPMREILTRLQEFQYIRILVFPEEVIVEKPVEEWPACDCLISFHSKGFPLEKAIQYATLRHPYVINNLHMQYDIQDRRKVYSILESQGIEIPRYAVLDRDSANPTNHELIESEDHVEVNGIVFNKPFVEKPVSAEDHNIYIYYPTSAGGGSQRLFRKIGSRSSVYSPESRVRKTGSFIYEDFMPTDGTDVKVYTVGPDYAHAEARKSPALDGKVERDSEGKEIRYPVILSNAEKLISRKVCLAFKQTVCGFDLLRANGKSFVCDVNGFSFVKNSNKYYDDCAKILGNMILRELAPTLHIPWSVPFQLDDPPIVPTTFGKMMELRCVVAVIRHGDRTPKQKMKVEVRHPKFFEIFEKYGGEVNGHVKLKRPKQLQEILDIARYLLNEIEHRAAPELAEKQAKLEQLKSVLEMYGHFSGINRKVQMKYQPKGRPKSSSSDDEGPKEPSLVLIVKWGGELTPAGRIQAEELGRIFRCMYPGGQGRHYTGEYAGTQGLGLLRLHSTYRHDLKIYASDEGRVQMTAAAFAKGLLALEGELTPILVQMVKSANTNGLLDNDYDASKHQDVAKTRLHTLMQQDRDFTAEDRAAINPCNSISIGLALDFVKNPVKCCRKVHSLIQKLMNILRLKRDDPKTKDAILYHGETWDLMGRRWGKIEKDFCLKNNAFDISKIPDIYDCIKYDLQHNQHTLQFEQAEELYINSKYLADIVIPQEYGMTMDEKLTISQGICTPLLKKIRADLQRNIEESEENVNRLNPRYSHGVSSPGRHVRSRLYFTSESHLHSLLTVLRYGGLVASGTCHLENIRDEQWRRAMEYVSTVSEINYMAQIVILLYEDPTKDPSSEERFHVELHFSPGVNCCVQKNLPPGPGFRPHSRNEHPTKGNLSSEPSSSTDASPSESPGPSSPILIRRQIGTAAVTEPIPIKASPKYICEEYDESGCSLKSNSRPLMVSPNVAESRSRSFDQSKQPAIVNDTTVGNKVFELRREAWGGTRSLSLPAAALPAEEEKFSKWSSPSSSSSTGSSNSSTLARRYGDKWRIAMVESDSLLTGLDLAHVSIVIVGDIRKRTAAIKGGWRGGMMAAKYWKKKSEFDDDDNNKLVTVRSGINKCNNPKCECHYDQLIMNNKNINNSNSSKIIRPYRLSLPTTSSSQIAATMVQTDRRQRHSISSLRPHHAHLHNNNNNNSNKLSASSTTSSVFSTAVISGAASAPNLTDIISTTASVSEGCGGVPAIRPLETLHNALSLKQIDSFLEAMSHSIKTPSSTPPKVSTSPLRSSSPSGTGWSDPPSFVSTSGASSPTPLPEFFLAQRFASSTNSNYFSHRDSIEVAEFYSRSVDNTHFSPIVAEDGGSGEVTPVSAASEDDEDMCSETLLHEADTTVIPTDTPRLRLADICWDKPQGSSDYGTTRLATESDIGTPTPTPSRFVCTSVNEPVHYEPPALTLATNSPSTTSVGFHVPSPTTKQSPTSTNE